MTRHWLIKRIARVLCVHLGRHTGQRTARLFLSAHAMQQPVRHVLGRNTPRRTVLPQADVMDVGYFGAAHALIYPAHDIARSDERRVGKECVSACKSRWSRDR